MNLDLKIILIDKYVNQLINEEISIDQYLGYMRDLNDIMGVK